MSSELKGHVINTGMTEREFVTRDGKVDTSAFYELGKRFAMEREKAFMDAFFGNEDEPTVTQDVPLPLSPADNSSPTTNTDQ
jgi:hypothetical protein